LTTRVTFEISDDEFANVKAVSGTAAVDSAGIGLGSVSVRAALHGAEAGNERGAVATLTTPGAYTWSMYVPVDWNSVDFVLSTSESAAGGGNTSRVYEGAAKTESVGSAGSTTIALTMNIYKITADATGGTLTPKVGEMTTKGALAGEVVSVDIAAAANYSYTSCSTTPATTPTATSDVIYTFSMPSQSITVNAVFTADEHSFSMVQTGTTNAVDSTTDYDFTPFDELNDPRHVYSGGLVHNYAEADIPAAYSVTITNSGNVAIPSLTVSLNPAGTVDYDLTGGTAADLAAGATRVFTVRPKTGKTNATTADIDHPGRVTVSGTGVTSVSFGVKFMVMCEDTATASGEV
jgi:hypothetical protein